MVAPKACVLPKRGRETKGNNQDSLMQRIELTQDDQDGALYRQDKVQGKIQGGAKHRGW